MLKTQSIKAKKRNPRPTPNVCMYIVMCDVSQIVRPSTRHPVDSSVVVAVTGVWLFMFHNKEVAMVVAFKG